MSHYSQLTKREYNSETELIENERKYITMKNRVSQLKEETDQAYQVLHNIKVDMEKAQTAASAKENTYLQALDLFYDEFLLKN